MNKPKRETVRDELIRHLRRNRDGKLTLEQLVSLTVEPLTTLLLLLSPAILIIGLRLPFLMNRGGLLLFVLAAGLGGMLLLRALHYARSPVRTQVLYAAEQPFVRRIFGQSVVFYDEDGKVYKFTRHLSPRISLIPNHAYRVYYLEDAEQFVLCSLMSREDAQAQEFEPSHTFEPRHRQEAHAAS
jgi:hypothetical protein